MSTGESPPMSPIRSLLTALVRLAVLVLLWGGALFGLSGDFGWLMAWLYIGAYVAMALVTMVAIGPELRAERATGLIREKSRVQQVASALAVLGWLGAQAVAALERRFWPDLFTVPAGVAWAALALVVAGMLFGVWSMLINRYFSSGVRIQEDRGQTVVTAGPYRVVRHPGYAGFIVMALATPFALDSLLAFIPAILLCAAIVIRTADEDRTLCRDLPGYDAYTHRTRWRLLPGVW
jgi:protein-S-isoprenylcysteine O-methyltransferase Ste14